MPYAIIDPGAMMIKPLYASIAYRAVSRSLRLYQATFGTERLRVKVLHDLCKSDHRASLDEAGLSQPGKKEEDESQGSCAEHQGYESPGVILAYKNGFKSLTFKNYLDHIEEGAKEEQVRDQKGCDSLIYLLHGGLNYKLL